MKKRAERARVEVDRPAVASGSSKTNLVAARSTFFGRGADLDALGALFARGDRLVTLTGQGGTGKTRLARQVAATHGASFMTDEASGIWFCEIEESRSLESICGAVAEALGVPMPGEATEAAVVRQLGATLGRRGRLLIIIDNCEQAIAHVAAALAVWLEEAPDAHFLLTSREPVKLPGEQVFEVAPLAVPAEGEDAASSDAVQLFVERAQRLRRGYELTVAESPIVAEIVRRLDGLPLAIELAAARMNVLGAKGVVERLSNRFDLLASASRDTSPRQRTLHTAIAWSWELLTPWEQAALRQASVFRGGFGPDAFEAVVDLSPWADSPAPLDVLQALRDKSLVRSFELPETPGELRCALYESIRAFAAEQLTRAGEDAAAGARHTGYFVAAGTAWDDGVSRPGGVEKLGRLVLEAENLRAACDRALAAGTREQWAAAAELMLALHRIAMLRRVEGGHLARLERTIGSPYAQGAPLAHLLLARGTRAMRSQRSAAAPALEGALALARRIGDRKVEGRVLSEMGLLARRSREFQAARVAFEGALAASREVGDAEYEGITLGRNADLLYDQDRLDEAEVSMEHALRVVRERGDRREEGTRLLALGALLHREMRWEEAKARHSEALGVFEELGDESRKALVLHNMGSTAQALGLLDEARECFERAIASSRLAFDERFHGLALGSLAYLLYELDNVPEARASALEATERLARYGEMQWVAFFRGTLAALQAAAGEVDGAQRTMEAAEKALAPENNEGRLALALDRAHIDVARARECASSGDPSGAAEHMNRARARLDAPSPSDLVHTAARMLGRAIALAEAGASARSLPRARPANVMRVAESGRWFEVPGVAERVDLTDRPTVGRILLALTRRRIEAPGASLLLEDLVREGWPGERMLAKAGATRVYTMLAKLRKMGLRDVIHHRSSGYLLDPRVEVVLDRDETGS